VAPGRFGKVIRDAVLGSAMKPRMTKKNRWTGRVLKVDRFGNLITSFHVDEFPDVLTRPFEVLAGNGIVRRLLQTYSESGEGEAAVIVGSSGFLEISVNQGSAAERMDCGAGAEVELAFSNLR
jgi:S-adenosylmethionine hydrolase